MAPNSSSPLSKATASIDEIERLEDLDRRSLMDLCKKNGIKCVGKNVDLVDKLKAIYISSSSSLPSSPVVDVNNKDEEDEESIINEESTTKSSPLKRFRESPLKCTPISLSLNDTPNKLGSPMRKRLSTQIGSPAIRKSILAEKFPPAMSKPDRPKYIAPHERVAMMAKENLLKNQQRQLQEQQKPSTKKFNLQQSLEMGSSAVPSYTPHKGKLKPFSL